MGDTPDYLTPRTRHMLCHDPLGCATRQVIAIDPRCDRIACDIAIAYVRGHFISFLSGRIIESESGAMPVVSRESGNFRWQGEIFVMNRNVKISGSPATHWWRMKKVRRIPWIINGVDSDISIEPIVTWR